MVRVKLVLLIFNPDPISGPNHSFYSEFRVRVKFKCHFVHPNPDIKVKSSFYSEVQKLSAIKLSEFFKNFRNLAKTFGVF